MAYWALLLGLASAALTIGSGMNGGVSRRIGIFASVFVYLTVGSLCAFVSMLVYPATRFSVHQLVSQPVTAFIPGFFNLGMIGVQLRIMRAAGIATLTGGIFIGQSITGILLDSIGFLGQPSIALTWHRFVGVGITFAGLWVLLQKRSALHQRVASSWRWAGLSIATGAVMSIFTDLNAHLGAQIGVIGSALLFLLPGALLLAIVTFAGVLSVEINTIRTQPILYVLFPGTINFIMIFLQNKTVPLVGVGAAVAITFFFRWPVRWRLITAGSFASRNARLAHCSLEGCL